MTNLKSGIPQTGHEALQALCGVGIGSSASQYQDVDVGLRKEFPSPVTANGDECRVWALAHMQRPDMRQDCVNAFTGLSE